MHAAGLALVLFALLGSLLAECLNVVSIRRHLLALLLALLLLRALLLLLLAELGLELQPTARPATLRRMPNLSLHRQLEQALIDQTSHPDTTNGFSRPHNA